MKFFNRKLLIGILVLTLSVGFFQAPAAQVQAAGSSSTNMNEWMDICLTMGKNLHKKGFRYSNSGVKRTYKAAVSSKRKVNCALYASWCLQEYGALDDAQTFYAAGHGRIKKNFSSWDSDMVKIIRVYKKASKAQLQKGDVVCYTDAHVCIYAGRNSAGKRVWFDGGKVSTYGNSSGSRYKPFCARQLTYLEKRKVSYIIRLKDL